MRGGVSHRLHSKLIIIVMLSAVVAALDVSLLVRPRLRSQSEDGDERGETYGIDALRFQWLKLRDGRGRIPPDAYGRAKAHIDRLRQASMLRRVEFSAAPQVSTDMFSASAPAAAIGPAPIEPTRWRWLGPGNVGGRIRAIAISGASPSTIFAGSVGGGIWKTTNAGASWAPVDDFMASLSVSALVFDPVNAAVIYAGTGEGYGNSDAIRGAGIFKSIDGGATWKQLAGTAPQSTAVNRIAVAPTGGIVLAATNTGLWRSLNGGGSFALASTGITPQDVDFNPIDARKAIAAGYGAVIYSWDGGTTWHPASGLPLSSGRVEVAYARSQPDTIYALVDYAGGTLYRSGNGGATFSAVSSTPLLDNGQGWYDAALWVNPTDSNHVVVGGVYLRQSVDGGSTWTAISDGIHVDQHVIVEDPRFDDVTYRTVFIGNDGGVFRVKNIRTAATSGYTALNNNLGVTQFYGGAANALSGVIVGGTQDNGNVVRQPLSGTSWSQTLGGDGGFVAGDPVDPGYFYGETIYLQLFRSSNGGGSWTPIGASIADAGQSANFIAPFVLDPNNSNRLYAGGSRLWVTTSAKSAAPAWKAVFGAGGSNYLSAIGVAPGSPDVVWLGLTYGNVYRSTNATASAPSFTPVPAPTLGNFVTRITVSPSNPNVVYVTTGGFGSQNLLKTSDGGATWVDATGGGATGLPDVPVNDLEVDPQDANTLYAATEVGVFTSSDGGATWDLPQSGPANVAVDDLFWMGTTLVAATHGRGMYSIDVNGAGAPSATASATLLDFGSQPLNAASGARRVTITNSGTAPLTVYSLAISGANARDFPRLTYTCAGTIAPGGACTADTLFEPTATGTRVATLTLASNASNGTLSIALRGTGVAASPVPTPWVAQDVGSVSVAGRSTYATGVFTMTGSGADIWGSADAFHFVHQPLAGDGTITARVAAVQNVAAWTKAGVMIRDGIGAGAANATMIVSAGKGLSFQYRKAAGGITANVAPPGAAPVWVKLTRAGTLITAAISSDGSAWTTVGQATMAMANTVQVGLVVSSHVATQAATAAFDHVAVTPRSTLPAGWRTTDIGAVGKAGAATESAGTFTVTGGGADIWGTADAFRFAYRPLAADGSIVARVATVQNVNVWTKAGVMLRQSLAANSVQASIVVTPGKGIAFQRRTTAGGLTINTSVAGAAPVWVKLARVGAVVTVSTSHDGVTWTKVGQQTLSIAGAVSVGLAVTSHDITQKATATFDHVAGTGW
jgi:regulation of enolase protein 1 (concanavalin A-like superfamily)